MLPKTQLPTHGIQIPLPGAIEVGDQETIEAGGIKIGEGSSGSEDITNLLEPSQSTPLPRVVVDVSRVMGNELSSVDVMPILSRTKNFLFSESSHPTLAYRGVAV